MKIYNLTLLFMMFTLTLFLFMNKLHAQISTQPISSSTSGIIQPETQRGVQTAKKPVITNPPPVCVDSGVQGRRCGTMAVNFCKLNPDAINCKKLLNETPVDQ